MAGDQGTFRCYYQDGTILTAPYCPLTNDNGAALLTSEFTIIENVEDKTAFPWWLLIFVMVYLASKKRSH